jgi:hypothetical protein
VTGLTSYPAPPGWYPISDDWRTERWWTGRGWSQHYRVDGRQYVAEPPHVPGLTGTQVKWLLLCTIGLPALPLYLFGQFLLLRRRRW